MQAFYMPVRMYTGENAVQAHLAAELKGRGCLIVTGGASAKRCGALEDILAVLSEQNAPYAIFDGVRENPTVESCRRAGLLAAEKNLEVILGVGGGSPMDAAKAAAVFAANPTLDEAGFYAAGWKNPPKPILLIGTTAGTGSEVTSVSVLTDSKGKKHSIRNDLLYAAAAFGDAKYTATMPLPVTRSTGVDVLAHCTESWFGKTATVWSRAYAAEGIRLLLAPLKKAAEGGELTAEDRRNLYDASVFGGLAIAITGTCLPHNVGYYFTESRHIPHGFACALFLPYLLKLAKEREPGLYEQFLRDTGLQEGALEQLIAALLPDTAVAMTTEEIEAALPRWENNGSVKKTVGSPSLEEIRALLTELFVK